MDRCVEKVMVEQGYEKERAISICHAQIVKEKEQADSFWNFLAKQHGGEHGGHGGAHGEGGGGEGGGGQRGAALDRVYGQSDRLTKLKPAQRQQMVSELAKESAADLKKMGGWVLEMSTATTDPKIKRNMGVMRDMLVAALDVQGGG